MLFFWPLSLFFPNSVRLRRGSGEACWLSGRADGRPTVRVPTAQGVGAWLYDGGGGGEEREGDRRGRGRVSSDLRGRGGEAAAVEKLR